MTNVKPTSDPSKGSSTGDKTVIDGVKYVADGRSSRSSTSRGNKAIETQRSTDTVKDNTAGKGDCSNKSKSTPGDNNKPAVDSAKVAAETKSPEPSVARNSGEKRNRRLSADARFADALASQAAKLLEEQKSAERRSKDDKGKKSTDTGKKVCLTVT